jgi:polynucleotide 5'-hydroxyl-kinase GRC3/NOL9
MIESRLEADGKQIEHRPPVGGREAMVENWADVVADRIADASPRRKGMLLLLGAADTGKTTLMEALVQRLVRRRPVALVDADIGQSHIGPPSTVGWSIREKDSSEALGSLRGMAFVGAVTPVGHLLQLTAALALCVEGARQAADVVLVDTPGLVTGGAACSLWWTVQQWLRPERIVAIQREHELEELLGGLQTGVSEIVLLQAPATLRRKSPQARQEHRRRLFEEYFRDAATCTLNLRGLAVRAASRRPGDDMLGRIVGLTDDAGRDLALGVIERWRPPGTKMTVRAPQLDIRRVRCLTIGDARIESGGGWSG